LFAANLLVRDKILEMVDYSSARCPAILTTSEGAHGGVAKSDGTWASTRDGSHRNACGFFPFS
jgi:hypothetical protein